MIPFNKPYSTHLEKKYIEDVFKIGKFSGNRKYAKKCQDYFKSKLRNQLNLCTTSCTDALEMSALLCNINPRKMKSLCQHSHLCQLQMHLYFVELKLDSLILEKIIQEWMKN